MLYVVTENDSGYAFDADTGTRLWHVSVLASGEKPSDIISSCFQIAPQIGITATPVIDRSSGPNGTIYVVAMSKNSSGKYTNACTPSASPPEPKSSKAPSQCRRRTPAVATTATADT